MDSVFYLQDVVLTVSCAREAEWWPHPRQAGPLPRFITPGFYWQSHSYSPAVPAWGKLGKGPGGVSAGPAEKRDWLLPNLSGPRRQRRHLEEQGAITREPSKVLGGCGRVASPPRGTLEGGESGPVQGKFLRVRARGPGGRHSSGPRDLGLNSALPFSVQPSAPYLTPLRLSLLSCKMGRYLPLTAEMGTVAV